MFVLASKDGKPVGSGSGTIVLDRSHVLTNMHVVAAGDSYTVALAPPKAARTSTTATLVDFDEQRDLALLRLRDPIGTPATISRDGTDLGEAIVVAGYPGVGGDTLTVTKGSVSGFLDINDGLGRAWIKTDAELNPGNSGGGAFTRDGALAGIPTFILTDKGGALGYVLSIDVAADFLSRGAGKTVTVGVPIPNRFVPAVQRPPAPPVVVIPQPPTSLPNVPAPPTAVPASSGIQSTFDNGRYIVGKQIAAGYYVAQGAGSACTISRIRGARSNSVSASGEFWIQIPQDADGEEWVSASCPPWRAAIPSTKLSFADGRFFVGVQIPLGRYVAAPSSSCYAVSAGGFGVGGYSATYGVLQGSLKLIMDVTEAWAGVMSQGCGTWTRVN